MRVLGLHHVSINVRDVAEAVDFYRDVMGFPVRSDRAAFSFDGAWLDVGDRQLHLLDKPVPEAVGQHFALRVEDIDAAVAELRERGVAVSDPVAVNLSRQAFLHDPSGNLVELHEVGEARPA